MAYSIIMIPNNAMFINIRQHVVNIGNPNNVCYADQSRRFFLFTSPSEKKCFSHVLTFFCNILSILVKKCPISVNICQCTVPPSFQWCHQTLHRLPGKPRHCRSLHIHPKKGHHRGIGRAKEGPPQGNRQGNRIVLYRALINTNIV